MQLVLRIMTFLKTVKDIRNIIFHKTMTLFLKIIHLITSGEEWAWSMSINKLKYRVFA